MYFILLPKQKMCISNDFYTIKKGRIEKLNGAISVCLKTFFPCSDDFVECLSWITTF